MNCPTCGCCAKENMANFKKFYYCGECKTEVNAETLRSNLKDLDLGELTTEERAEFEEWLDGIDKAPQDGFDFFFPDTAYGDDSHD